MEYRVPEFILDIYACLYQEIDLDLHVMMSVCDVDYKFILLNFAPSAYLRRWTQ